jgi:hypothetical protein
MENIDCATGFVCLGENDTEPKFTALSFLTDLFFVSLLREEESIKEDYKKTGVINLDVIFDAMDKATQKEPIKIVSHNIGEIELTNSNVKKLHEALKDIKVKEPALPNLFSKMI